MWGGVLVIFGMRMCCVLGGICCWVVGLCCGGGFEVCWLLVIGGFVCLLGCCVVVF